MTTDHISKLIQQAVGGDRFSLEELLLSFSPRLMRHVSAKLPASLQGSVGVDDILQQTFVRAFRGISGLDRMTEQSFGAWLKSIADNLLQDAIKAQKRKKRGGEFRQAMTPQDESMLDLVALISDGDHTPSRSVGRREAIQAIRIGIAGLPVDQRDAIQLHLLDGKSLGETAEILDRTPGAIRASVYRGKKTLGEVLGRASLWLSRK